MPARHPIRSVVAAALAVVVWGVCAPAGQGATSARHTLRAEYRGVWDIDSRWPDGGVAYRMHLETLWSATSALFTLENGGTTRRPRLRSRTVRLTGPLEHAGDGTRDMGDWVAVTGDPKTGDCMARERQFLDNPGAARARAAVTILPPADRRPRTEHIAIVSLVAPGVVVRVHRSAFPCTALTGPGEPTEVFTVPDLVSTCATGDVGCLVLPLTNLRNRWRLSVPSRTGGIRVGRPIRFVALRNGLTDPVLRQELPNGGSQTYTFDVVLTLVPAVRP